MGADTDFDYQPLKQSLFDWIDWYVDTANIDGFRIDAVKHIKFEFFKEWLSYIRNSKKREDNALILLIRRYYWLF